VTRRTQAVGAGVFVLMVMTGCSGNDGDGEADPVAAAEERVDRARTASDEANVALDEAGDQFCEDSAQYIESVDRYGGLLTDAEATVGAVNDAGRDLEGPREDVVSSAEEVQGARGEVAAAEAELAAAQVALAEAETGTTSPDEGTTTTTAPLVSEDVVDRVERAEADLAAAFDGVDDSTPLSEAAVQVNAAAVSVQVAWMQLFASAGCLTDEQRAEAVVAVGDYTRTLQAALTEAGYFDGEVDGVYGQATVAAVEQLQADAGLPQTGLVDRATTEALDAAVGAAGGDAAATELAHTAALQSALTIAGYWTGPIDGQWSDALTAALQAFQTDLGVEPTGVVDPATISAAQQALDELQDPTSTTTTTTEDSGEDTTTTTTTATG
jgi:peptidoglycan hydrolase-like protein with peptidoglycan-binding domain